MFAGMRRRRVEGQFRSLEETIEDKINPINSAHLASRLSDEARPKPPDTLKRSEWAFWCQKLFSAIDKIDNAPFLAKWEFVHQQGVAGGEFIRNPV